MPFLGTTPTQGFVSAVTKQTFTPNGSTTVFTLSHSVANENDLEVFVGNIRQEPGSGKAYTAAGTTLTMSEAVASGVNFYVIFKNKAQVTTTPPVNSISTDKIVNDAVTGAKIENNPTIAGNLTVSGNFTSIGIDDNADANAMTIDSSERVLIGMTTASGSTDGIQFVKDGRIFSNVDGSAPLILNRKTSDGGIATFRKDGTDIGSISVMTGDNLAIASTSADHAGIMLGGHSIIPLEANAQADGTINLGSASRRFQNLILSGGVRIGGTGTANTLDDYEEGTWTPQLTNGSSNIGTTVGGNSYTKIGRLVHLECQIQRNDSSSDTNIMQVSGLPFPHYSNPSIVGGAWLDNTSSDIRCFLYLPSGNTSMYFVKAGGSNSYVSLNELDNGRYIYLGLTYNTT